MEIPSENIKINKLKNEINSEKKQLKEKENSLNQLRQEHFNNLYKSMGFNSHMELIHELNKIMGLGLNMPKKMQKKTFEKYKKEYEIDSISPEELTEKSKICLVEARIIFNSTDFFQYTERYNKIYGIKK